MTIESILRRLSNVRETPTGWMALCPAHNDTKPSVSISLGRHGNVLLYCHAGCSFEKIIAKISPMKSRNIEATYDYKGADGTLLYQVVRYEGKEFRHRRPDGRGGWL